MVWFRAILVCMLTPKGWTGYTGGVYSLEIPVRGFYSRFGRVPEQELLFRLHPKGFRSANCWVNAAES